LDVAVAYPFERPRHRALAYPVGCGEHGHRDAELKVPRDLNVTTDGADAPGRERHRLAREVAMDQVRLLAPYGLNNGVVVRERSHRHADAVGSVAG
jgi:hypothetical protein